MELNDLVFEDIMELTDPVFDDMAMSEMADRRRFRSVCFETYMELVKWGDGTKLKWVVFEEWKVYVSLLLQVGIWDLRDENTIKNIFDGRKGYMYSIRIKRSDDETDSRINSLTVDDCYNLPKGLHRLNCLKTLTIRSGYIKSLSLQEISSIPELKRLDLYNAPKDLLDNLCGHPEAEKLQRVTTLSFGCGGNVREDELAKFVLEVVPRFPSLERLDLCFSFDYANFKVLAERLRNGDSLAIPKTLRTLGLTLFDNVQNPTFKADMLTLLKFFPTIDDVAFGGDYGKEILRDGFGYGMKGDPDTDLRKDPEYRYALAKNMAGRRIVQNGGGSLQLSAWPIVLERAQRIIRQRATKIVWDEDEYGDSDDRYCNSPVKLRPGESREDLAECLSVSGMYYLLREGPALIGRSDLQQNHITPLLEAQMKEAAAKSDYATALKLQIRLKTYQLDDAIDRNDIETINEIKSYLWKTKAFLHKQEPDIKEVVESIEQKRSVQRASKRQKRG